VEGQLGWTHTACSHIAALIVGATRGSIGKGPCHRALNKHAEFARTAASSHQRPSSQSKGCWGQPPSSRFSEHNYALVLL